ncbi:hypothetical protein H4683_003137 [Filibacter limicola]|uniref:Uncharacterized protein n=1 Tax=Sporosarcina limicola TaxID=34101 RepID=A0A927MRG5_9BACL|nr:hypothetical protein [Sporosarcina limicola]
MIQRSVASTVVLVAWFKDQSLVQWYWSLD